MKTPQEKVIITRKLATELKTLAECAMAGHPLEGTSAASVKIRRRIGAGTLRWDAIEVKEDAK